MYWFYGGRHSNLFIFHLTRYNAQLFLWWYILDVLRGQLIKLIQVVSTSDLHENWCNGHVFFQNHCINFLQGFRADSKISIKCENQNFKCLIAKWMFWCPNILSSFYFWDPAKNQGVIWKRYKVVPSILMKLWSRNNLDKLDWLTPQDI